MNYPVVIIIPIIVGLIAHLIKSFLIVRKRRQVKLSYFFEYGNMPSAHTAFVISLISVIGYRDGIASSNFAIAFVFAFIVIGDALRFRRSLESYGEAINLIIQKNPDILNDKKIPALEERVGHKISEVIVGAILGFLLTGILIKIFNF